MSKLFSIILFIASTSIFLMKMNIYVVSHGHVKAIELIKSKDISAKSFREYILNCSKIIDTIDYKGCVIQNTEGKLKDSLLKEYDLATDKIFKLS